MSDSSRSYLADAGPLFHDVPPRVTWIVRAVGLVTLLMVVLAFILCIVRAETHDSFFYLLACNTVMSFLIGAVSSWWYRSGHLAGDKYWYMFVVAGVIIWQCIATDVYIFHANSVNGTSYSTEADTTTAATYL